MSSLTLRTAKGSPLTNAEVDANFTNLLVAIGGANTSPYTLPTPTGTGSPVLSNSPTITGNVNIGAQANLTRFPNSVVSISNTAAGIQQNESHNIGLIAEGTANSSNTAIYGVGLYGVGYTAGATRSGGVVGEGHVSASADTGSAIGVRGYSNDTHTGGLNIGLYGDASGGSSSYALYLNNGDIFSNTAKTWSLGGNLTLSGAYTLGFTSGASLTVPSGTTASRPATPSAGNIRYNTDLNTYEGYSGSAWGSIGSGTGGQNGLLTNASTVSTSQSISAGSNAFSVGPITVANGAIVTVASGQRWVVI